jgi:phosphoglycolate phosphatase-like HAD superfamily hydrolase
VADRSRPLDARSEGPPWVVLFDIDGTLLRCGSQIRDIFRSSLEDAYGRRVRLEGYSFAGRTDHGILHDLLPPVGLTAAAIDGGVEAFEALYLERLEARLDAARMTLLPGVVELLDRLAERNDVLVGLLTGNLERGAKIKLSRLGIDAYFGFGAYGDRVADRSDLPPVALERARGLGMREVDPSRAIIVGDSLLDVRCALAHDLRCLAVTTGFATRDELVVGGAHLVVTDLREAGSWGEPFRHASGGGAAVTGTLARRRGSL